MKLFLRLEDYLPSGTNDIVLPLIVRGRLGQYPNKTEEIEGDDERHELTRNIPCWSRGKCGRHFRFGDGDGTDDEMSFASKCNVDGKFIYFRDEVRKIGSRFMIYLQIPAKLSKSIEIDPGVTLGDEFYYEDDNDDKDDKVCNAISVQLNFMLLFVMLAAIFAFN